MTGSQINGFLKIAHRLFRIPAAANTYQSHIIKSICVVGFLFQIFNKSLFCTIPLPQHYVYLAQIIKGIVILWIEPDSFLQIRTRLFGTSDKVISAAATEVSPGVVRVK